MAPSTSWQDIAKKAQDLRDASINQVNPPVPEVPSALLKNVTDIPEHLLTAEEAVITQLLPEALVPSLASGELKATTVVNAFLRRAGIAQKLTNCITELLPEEALNRAKYLDAYLLERKKPVGPLHGLPISVKEHCGMKGKGLNAGYISWWDRKSEDDASVLKILWRAGCIFYARTTEPQTLMHLETSSNFYGVTVNPYNRDLTCGGSSGGEGALLGLRGSCLGIGSDIGGSIRVPAANCALYGLRPTTFRLPIDGWEATSMGEEQIIPVIGPLSTSLGGIKLFMKTVLSAKPWVIEPACLPIPWRDEENHLPTKPGQKLRIAVLWSDGVVKPHPPITRALEEVTRKLKGVSNVEVTEWKPYKHDEGWEIVNSLYFADGGREVSEAISASGEPWRPLSKFIIQENPYVKYLSIEEVWSWTIRREKYRSEYNEMWNKTAISIGANGEPEGAMDVILAPVGPGAAPPIDHGKYWGYTSQWNLLDYPALVFPVTKVDPKVDKVEEGYQPINNKDAYNYSLCESRYE
ncbi:MAG: hypothetical protein Q9219_004055 [cf. Caloplaca sp. 3 TL-2023]